MRESKPDGLIQQAALPPSIDSEPYEAALGKLAIRFSWLHFQLELFSWKLWKLELSTGMILTKDLPTKHLVEKLRQSAALAMPRAADLRDFKSILKKVEKVAEKRNELLHSLWQFNSESVTRLNRKLAATEKATSIDEIKDLITEITEVSVMLHDFKEGCTAHDFLDTVIAIFAPTCGSQRSAIGAPRPSVCVVF